ncbi:MAG TPA: hypothetical protein VMP68_13230 [Candidatus Eisenbacteria bacterium]|nr:hypothetical protein [Candidatus Eisenbacteria bacterium]
MGEPDDYYQSELSPDGKKAAAAVGTANYGIWIYDSEHNTRTRFTFGKDVHLSPIWSRDGKQIAYMQGAYGGLSNESILAKAADGSGEEQKLMDLGRTIGLQEGLYDWSPDGRYILFTTGTASMRTGTDIWVLPLFGDRKAFPYINAPGNQMHAQFSPDGDWVACASDESGHWEVYVAPFPGTGAKWQVSNGDGLEPLWRGTARPSILRSRGIAESSRRMLTAMDRVLKWVKCTLCFTSTINLPTLRDSSTPSAETGSDFSGSPPERRASCR